MSQIKTSTADALQQMQRCSDEGLSQMREGVTAVLREGLAAPLTSRDDRTAALNEHSSIVAAQFQSISCELTSSRQAIAQVLETAQRAAAAASASQAAVAAQASTAREAADAAVAGVVPLVRQQLELQAHDRWRDSLSTSMQPLADEISAIRTALQAWHTSSTAEAAAVATATSGDSRTSPAVSPQMLCAERIAELRSALTDSLSPVHQGLQRLRSINIASAVAASRAAVDSDALTQRLSSTLMSALAQQLAPLDQRLSGVSAAVEAVVQSTVSKSAKAASTVPADATAAITLQLQGIQLALSSLQASAAEAQERQLAISAAVPEAAAASSTEIRASLLEAREEVRQLLALIASGVDGLTASIISAVEQRLSATLDTVTSLVEHSVSSTRDALSKPPQPVSLTPQQAQALTEGTADALVSRLDGRLQQLMEGWQAQQSAVAALPQSMVALLKEMRDSILDHQHTTLSAVAPPSLPEGERAAIAEAVHTRLAPTLQESRGPDEVTSHEAVLIQALEGGLAAVNDRLSELTSQLSAANGTASGVSDSITALQQNGNAMQALLRDVPSALSASFNASANELSTELRRERDGLLASIEGRQNDVSGAIADLRSDLQHYRALLPDARSIASQLSITLAPQLDAVHRSAQAAVQAAAGSHDALSAAASRTAADDSSTTITIIATAVKESVDAALTPQMQSLREAMLADLQTASRQSQASLVALQQQSQHLKTLTDALQCLTQAVAEMKSTPTAAPVPQTSQPAAGAPLHSPANISAFLSLDMSALSERLAALQRDMEDVERAQAEELAVAAETLTVAASAAGQRGASVATASAATSP